MFHEEQIKMTSSEDIIRVLRQEIRLLKKRNDQLERDKLNLEIKHKLKEYGNYKNA